MVNFVMICRPSCNQSTMRPGRGMIKYRLVNSPTFLWCQVLFF